MRNASPTAMFLAMADEATATAKPKTVTVKPKKGEGPAMAGITITVGKGEASALAGVDEGTKLTTALPVASFFRGFVRKFMEVHDDVKAAVDRATDAQICDVVKATDTVQHTRGMVLPANEVPAPPLKPGEEALDKPASSVAALPSPTACFGCTDAARSA
jgi:hypothetical protein